MHNNRIEKQFIREAFRQKLNLLILFFFLRVFLRNLIIPSQLTLRGCKLKHRFPLDSNAKLKIEWNFL